MEGPTPVSSLLHSCTLVMAGILVVFSLPVVPTFTETYQILFMVCSLVICCINPVLEKDAKRTVASSTVVMIGFCFWILLTSFSSTSLVIALVHAGYKSALFLTVGKTLSHCSQYSDLAHTPNALKSPLVIVGIFLVAFKTSSYGSSKHAIDVIVIDIGNDVGSEFVLAIGILLM